MSNLSDLLPAGGSGKTVELVASGALANGNKVILKSDGTVEVVGVSTTSQGAGSPVTFNSGNTAANTAVFDSNSNKIIITYQDWANSGYGASIVGTVSGKSISFGTEVVFNSASSGGITSAFDSNLNKVVIAYKDGGNSNYGKAKVGTVSGTTISFGSPTTFNSAASGDNSAVFDSNLNKIVIAYQDGGNSSYGKAKVGTVSGTTISFGSPTTFNSAATYDTTTTFDSNLNKVVISWSTNYSVGTSIVGTVSGTTISFGSPNTFESSNAYYITSAFDSVSNKIVIAYKGYGSSGYATARVGTVSGTTISFGSQVVFNSVETDIKSAVFDSDSNKIIIAYQALGGGSYLTLIVGTVSGTSISFGSEVTLNSYYSTQITSVFDSVSNKTIIAYRYHINNVYQAAAIVWQQSTSGTMSNLSTNFIGTSEGAFADTATATVMLRGGITTTQSGLTTGSKYYVQGDGTLSTTPDSPSVTAGKALASTTLLIGGSS
jgi:hypothetical protein